MQGPRNQANTRERCSCRHIQAAQSVASDELPLRAETKNGQRDIAGECGPAIGRVRPSGWPLVCASCHRHNLERTLRVGRAVYRVAGTRLLGFLHQLFAQSANSRIVEPRTPSLASQTGIDTSSLSPAVLLRQLSVPSRSFSFARASRLISRPVKAERSPVRQIGPMRRKSLLQRNSLATLARLPRSVETQRDICRALVVDRPHGRDD